MPIYEYEAVDAAKGCDVCRGGFEHLHKVSETLETCPRCGGKVRKVFSAPNVGASKSGFDDRAKAGGFHKLQRLGKGEYEKVY